MLGTSLGNYRVVERLGEGGMGVVYLGRHETLDRRVAVKVLHPELSRNAGMVQRFFNEAQAAAAIRNPGIVQIFDFGTTPAGRAYFVMELLEGQSLTARVRQQRLDYMECCRIGRQVANVLQAAHAAGITHRDLKPDNLFLIRDPEVIGGERVKVLDFGIAKLAGEAHASGVQTNTGLMTRSPTYMSPEQCRSFRTADARSDIYSLGCILFEMTCGRPPFLGEGMGDVLGAHLHTPPPHPQNLAPNMPHGLSTLIAKMLSKHPDARPQKMAAVVQALDEIVRTLGPALGAPTPLPVAVAAPLPAAVPAPLPAAAPAPLPVPSSGPQHVRPPTPLPVPSLVPPDTTKPFPLSSSITLDDRATKPFPLSSSTTLDDRDSTLEDHAPAPLSMSSPTTPHARAPTPLPVLPSAPLPVLPSAPLPVHPSAPLPVLPSAPLPVHPSAPLPVLQHSPPSPAFRAMDARSGAQPRADAHHRRLFGGLVIAVVVTVIVIALAAGDSGSPGQQVFDSVIADALPPVETAAAVVEDAAAGPPLTPAAVEAAAQAAAELEAECRGFQVDRKWGELEQCADKLLPLVPERAAELKTRAVNEAKVAPRIAAFEAAIRNKNLRRARAELDQVGTESVDHAKLERDYELAEAQAIDALAAELATVKDSGCEEYDALLAKARAGKPTRVIAEAARRTPCAPAAKCDANVLADSGQKQFAAGQLAASLASYEATYACNPSPAWSEKAFILACNLRNLPKAKLHWKRLPLDMKTRTLGVCVRNGITEATLNAP